MTSSNQTKNQQQVVAAEPLDYDFSVCRDLAINAPRNDRDYTEATQYFFERVFYAKGGIYYVYEDGFLAPYSILEFEKTQMKGFPKDFANIISQKIVSYKNVLEAKDYVIDRKARKINSLQALHASKLGHVVKTKESAEYLEYVKSFLLNIIANGKVPVYEVFTKWMASVIQLKKPPIAPVLVTSSQGVGKTSVARIIRAIIGKRNVANPTAKQLSKFNWACYGKVLVVLEETESLMKNDHEGGLNDTLKNMMTNDTFSYEAKCVQAKDLPNINSLYITSNFPLVSCVGRRYFNIIPSTMWLGEYANFKKLENFTDENVKELYDYFMSIDVSNWNAEEAVTKLDADSGNLKAIETMPNAWRYMKHEYALGKVNASIKKSELYENYKLATTKPFSKSTFFDKLSELNIQEVKIHGADFYKINGDALFKEFKKRNLICNDDVSEQDPKPDAWAAVDTQCGQDEVKSLREELAKLKASAKEVEKLTQENEKLQSKNEKLKAKNQKMEEHARESDETKTLRDENEKLKEELEQMKDAMKKLMEAQTKQATPQQESQKPEEKPQPGVKIIKIKAHSYNGTASVVHAKPTRE